jgi:hypothetical protein
MQYIFACGEHITRARIQSTSPQSDRVSTTCEAQTKRSFKARDESSTRGARRGKRDLKDTNRSRPPRRSKKVMRRHGAVHPSKLPQERGKRIAYLEEPEISSDEECINVSRQRHSGGNCTNEAHATRSRHRGLKGSRESTEHTTYEGGQTVRSDGQLSAMAHCYDTPPPSPQLNEHMSEDIERNDTLGSFSATREKLSTGNVAQADTPQKSEALMYGNKGEMQLDRHQFGAHERETAIGFLY